MKSPFHRILFYTMLITSVYINCGSSDKKVNANVNSSTNDSSIFLIIHKDENFNDTRKKSASTIIPEKLTYINEELKEISVLTKINKINDTIIQIDTKIPIWLSYEFPTYIYGRKITYRAIPGDTVRINFKNGLAYFNTKKDDSDNLINKYFDALFSTPLYPESFKLPKNVYLDTEQFKKRKKIYDYSVNLLDSLSNLASKDEKEALSTYKTILKYEWAGDLLLLSQTTEPDIFLNKIRDEAVADSVLLNNSIYRQFLISSLYYISTATSKTKDGRLAIDFTKVFDDTKIRYTGIVRDFLLAYCLKEIYPKVKKAKYDDYYSKFQSVATTSTFINEMEHFTEGNRAEIITDIVQSTIGTTMQLDSLLVTLKGKLVFIDFWASWCVPCRAAMPASARLREQLKNKDVVFLYISTDKEKTKWINASREESLFDFPTSYLLLNPAKASIIKNFKIETIPRYILFGKKGELLYRETPGPDDKKLLSIINNELKK